MQKMGDQITKSIDRQMEYMIEKLGPISSSKSNIQKEPVPIPVNSAPQLSYRNVKIMNRPSLPGFMTHPGSRMFEHGSSSSNQPGQELSSSMFGQFGNNGGVPASNVVPPLVSQVGQMAGPVHQPHFQPTFQSGILLPQHTGQAGN